MLRMLQGYLVLCVSGLWKELENMPEIMSNRNKLLKSSISHQRQDMRVLTVNVRRIVHTRAKRNTTIAHGWVSASPNYTEQSCGWLHIYICVCVCVCVCVVLVFCVCGGGRHSVLEEWNIFWIVQWTVCLSVSKTTCTWRFKCCHLWHCVIRHHSASNTLSYPRRLYLQHYHCGNPMYWEVWAMVRGATAYSVTSLSSLFNPLLSLMLQSARDLNVPCRPKRSKALLLSSS
jgi:hypothetical protein